MASKKLNRKMGMADAERMAFYEKAREMGFFSLNPQEKQLIDLMRYMSYHGRNVVIDMARAIRRSHPWVHGADASNTATTYPDDGFYLVPMKEAP